VYSVCVWMIVPIDVMAFNVRDYAKLLSCTMFILAVK